MNNIEGLIRCKSEPNPLLLPKGENKIEKMQKQLDMLTIPELCEWLDISKKYAYQFIREHNIKYIKVGKKFYISRKSVESVLRMED